MITSKNWEKKKWAIIFYKGNLKSLFFLSILWHYLLTLDNDDHIRFESSSRGWYITIIIIMARNVNRMNEKKTKQEW